MDAEASAPTSGIVQQETEAPRLEQLLAKYISVWLWSILFGASTGLLYALSDIRARDWAKLSVVFAIPAVLAFAFALISWWHLLSGLRQYLIPIYVLQHAEADRYEFAYHLSRAFQFMIYASVMRILVTVVELALAAAA